MAEFSEEIAFLGGEETEKMLIERDYLSLMKHENRVLRRRWWFGCVEEGIIKWLWGSFGVSIILIDLLSSLNWKQLVLCAIPVFVRIPGVAQVDLGSRTEGIVYLRSVRTLNDVILSGFVTNRRLLLSSSGNYWISAN